MQRRRVPCCMSYARRLGDGPEWPPQPVGALGSAGSARGLRGGSRKLHAMLRSRLEMRCALARPSRERACRRSPRRMRSRLRSRPLRHVAHSRARREGMKSPRASGPHPSRRPTAAAPPRKRHRTRSRACPRDWRGWPRSAAAARCARTVASVNCGSSSPTASASTQDSEATGGVGVRPPASSRHRLRGEQCRHVDELLQRLARMTPA